MPGAGRIVRNHVTVTQGAISRVIRGWKNGRILTTILTLVLSLAMALGMAWTVTAPVATAAEDVVRGSSNYGRAVAALDDDTVLWRPTYTAGLRRKGPIDVIAYGKGRKRATFTGSTYGRRVPSFTLAQKSAQTRWAAKPIEYDSAGLVRSEAIRLGEPGSRRIVRARVYANCRQSSQAPRRCSPADVARFGGTVEVLARSTVDGQARATTVRIDSNGLSFRQLIRVVEGLVPVVR